MRRSLTAAALALAALAAPASAEIPIWDYVQNPLENCMDCFPQVMCVNYPRCPVSSLVDPPTP